MVRPSLEDIFVDNLAKLGIKLNNSRLANAKLIGLCYLIKSKYKHLLL